MSLFCVSSGLRDAGSFHPHQHLIPLTLVGAKSTSLWFRLHVLMSHAGERLAKCSFLSMYFYSAPAQPRGALLRSGALLSGSCALTNIIFIFFFHDGCFLVFCVRIVCLPKCINFIQWTIATRYYKESGGKNTNFIPTLFCKLKVLNPGAVRSRFWRVGKVSCFLSLSWLLMAAGPQCTDVLTPSSWQSPLHVSILSNYKDFTHTRLELTVFQHGHTLLNWFNLKRSSGQTQ